MYIVQYCANHIFQMATANEPETAEIYFVDSRHAEPRKSSTPKKRHISEQQIPAQPYSEEEESPENASTSKKSELIHLKTYTSALDGKRIVLGMERRLEPLNKPKTSRVKRQVVAPYSRTNETQDAVKTIEQVLHYFGLTAPWRARVAYLSNILIGPP